MNSTIKVGDRVGYSHAFLRQIQAPELSTMRGTVVEYPYIGKLFANANRKMCRIQWDNAEDVKSCMVKNLRVAK